MQHVQETSTSKRLHKNFAVGETRTNEARCRAIDNSRQLGLESRGSIGFAIESDSAAEQLLANLEKLRIVRSLHPPGKSNEGGTVMSNAFAVRGLMAKLNWMQG